MAGLRVAEVPEGGLLVIAGSVWARSELGAEKRLGVGEEGESKRRNRQPANQRGEQAAFPACSLLRGFNQAEVTFGADDDIK